MIEKFNHLKGFLLLLVLWLTVGSIFSNVVFYLGINELLDLVEDTSIERMLNISMFILWIGTALGFLSSYFLLQKTSNAISFTVYILWITGPIATFILLTLSEPEVGQIIAFFKACVPALLWTFYLKKSNYIKSVYLNKKPD